MKGRELGRRAREVADSLRARIAARARDLGRRAQAGAGRVLREVGTRLTPPPTEAEPNAQESGPERTQGGEPSGCERNRVVGPRTAALCELMVEVLERSGYREVRADLGEREPPELVRGTVRSHRPSLFAMGGRRPALFDVFVPGEVGFEEQLSRWQLFASAAEQLSGEFHVVVPPTIDGVPGKEWTRRLSEAVGLTVTKVWEV